MLSIFTMWILSLLIISRSPEMIVGLSTLAIMLLGAFFWMHSRPMVGIVLLCVLMPFYNGWILVELEWYGIYTSPRTLLLISRWKELLFLFFLFAARRKDMRTAFTAADRAAVSGSTSSFQCVPGRSAMK